MVIVVIGSGNWDMGNSFRKFYNKMLNICISQLFFVTLH